MKHRREKRKVVAHRASPRPKHIYLGVAVVVGIIALIVLVIYDQQTSALY